MNNIPKLGELVEVFTEMQADLDPDVYKALEPSITGLTKEMQDQLGKFERIGRISRLMKLMVSSEVLDIAEEDLAGLELRLQNHRRENTVWTLLFEIKATDTEAVAAREETVRAWVVDEMAQGGTITTADPAPVNTDRRDEEATLTAPVAPADWITRATRTRNRPALVALTAAAYARLRLQFPREFLNRHVIINQFGSDNAEHIAQYLRGIRV